MKDVPIGTLEEWAVMENEYLRCKHYLEADEEERKRIDKAEKKEKLIALAFVVIPLFLSVLILIYQGVNQ